MLNLTGEYECKLDSKLRLALPAGLKKQLPPADQGRFVMNRGFEKHLNLFPFTQWQTYCEEVESGLNLLQSGDRAYMRNVRRGASELNLDNAGRLLLPKRLLDYAGITEEVILVGFGRWIECWDVELYESVFLNPEQSDRLDDAVRSKTPQPDEAEDRQPNYQDVPFIAPGQRH
jgi:MraZ protein